MKSLSRKPFYSLIAVIVLGPVLIFFLNIILIVVLGMKTVDENRIDKLLHFFGAVSICFTTAGVLWHLARRKIIDLHDANVFRVLVYGFLCFVMISWEILEYIVDIGSEYLTYSDTITDMICGLIGGLFAMFLVRRPTG